MKQTLIITAYLLVISLFNNLSAGTDWQLSDNWKVRSSAGLPHTGADISNPSFNDSGWYTAHVPSTLMAILLDNDVYPTDLLNGNQLKTVDATQFNVPWWYRYEFHIPDSMKSKEAFLQFDGINYRANIWLNGKLVASADSLAGAYRRFNLNVTRYLRAGPNALAIEINRRKNGEPGLGFVDWNPPAPDDNTGIWRPVTLHFYESARISDTRVQTDFEPDTRKNARLTVTTTVQNLSGKLFSGTIKGTVAGQRFSQPVTLEPREVQTVTLSPFDHTGLQISNPDLWWTHTLGNPTLYTLILQLERENQLVVSDTVTFGIRKIETYFTDDGHRGFKLNGIPILILGAGWTDDIFLRDTPKTNEIQVKYVKAMGLNTIRLEGFWGTSENLYDLCDQNGILLMAGWSCQWEWEHYLGAACTDLYGGITTSETVQLVGDYFEDQVKWLRNHPSIFVWMAASDKIPVPELETRNRAFLAGNDDNPYVISAGGGVSSVSGPSGMKMRGPYQYVAPSYWYTDSLRGGAFGFNTETGPGIQMPVLQSVKQMVGSNHFWPVDSLWNYHSNPSDVFNNFELFDKALTGRFGPASSLEEYVQWGEFISWEAMKPMVESFRAREPKTTGLIQWMLNSAWPSFYWQLYDHSLIPTSAFYAVRTATRPVQLVYDYSNQGVYLVSTGIMESQTLTATIRTFSFDSKPVQHITKTVRTTNSYPQQIATIESLKTGQFILLALTDSTGKKVASNYYVLPAGSDNHDWANSTWFHTPVSGFGSLKELLRLPKTTIQADTTVLQTATGSEMTVEITNTGGTMAFFMSVQLTDETGTIITPVFWSDNYLLIPPGETRKINAVLPKNLKNIGKLKPVLSGFNLENNN